MQIITKVFQSFLIVLLYTNSPIVLSSTLTDTGGNSLNDKLNEIFSKQKNNKAGLSVLIRKDNEVIFKRSKGLAKKKRSIPINFNTGFRIGSISKPFTALAIMKLVEQKKLSIDNSVTKFVTELPLSWKDITLKHLLSHRVYISSDFFSDSNLDIANLSTNQNVVKFLSSKNIKVSSLAAEKAQYCNSCYVLLAEVIARVSKDGFAEYLQKTIFTPANMKDTYIVEQGVSLKCEDALNYAKTESFLGVVQYTTGAMAQVSSVEDLNNFIIALKKNIIVSEEILGLMTEVHADLGDDGLFGLGWIIGRGEAPFFSHGGSQDGYQSELFIYPKYELEVVILTNGGDDTYELQGQLMRTITSHFKV